MGGDWHHKGLELTPFTAWTFLSIVLLSENLQCLFEKTENKRKRGLGWPIF